MLANYSDLQSALGNWLARPDALSRVVDYIALAEAKFNRVIRNRQMEQRATATETEYLALPTDYLETRALRVTSTTPVIALQYISSWEADRRYGNYSGPPSFYTHVDNQFRVVGPPDATYTIELDYYKKIPALTGSATTNWLLTDHPDVYLYGSMLEALIDLPGDPRTPNIASAFQAAVDGVNGADSRNRYSGGPLAPRTTAL